MSGKGKVARHSRLERASINEHRPILIEESGLHELVLLLRPALWIAVEILVFDVADV